MPCILTTNNFNGSFQPVPQVLGIFYFLELFFKNNLESINDINSNSRQLYLLYESAVAESHLHQADWPIKKTKKYVHGL